MSATVADPDKAAPTGSTGPHDQAAIDHWERRQQEAQAAAKGVQPGAEKKDPPPANTAVKPEGIPDKFWDAEKGQVRVEDLLRSYGELEKKLGGQRQDEGSDKKDEPKLAPDATPEDARKVVADAGLDYDAFTKEFSETGTLSEGTYKALADKGISKEVVDQYIAGQQALAEKIVDDVASTVGGREQLQAVIQWAAKNLSNEEIDAFNSVSATGNTAQVKLAVQGLKSRMDAAVGRDPKLLNSPTSAASAEVFRSQAEVRAAMDDPRYAKDPAYRADVYTKLARSKL